MSEFRFSVVVPCYNEREAIQDTINEIRTNLRGLEPYELIVVDDGSSDGTDEVLRQLGTSDPKLVILFHEWNRGYGAALKTGIGRSRADLIAITDADGTYPNERITELITRCEDENLDMVIGARVGEDVHYPLIRKIPKSIMKVYISWLAGQPVIDMNSGLRVFRRDVVNRFLKILPNSFSFTTTITLAMLSNYYKVAYVPISYSPRIGKSKIKPIKDTLRFFQLLIRTGMYFAPLRVFFPIFLVLAIAFLASLTYDLWIAKNIGDKSVLLLMFTANTAMFALLADMIDKRSP